MSLSVGDRSLCYTKEFIKFFFQHVSGIHLFLTSVMLHMQVKHTQVYRARGFLSVLLATLHASCLSKEVSVISVRSHSWFGHENVRI
jgi:hypothetical protein